jgi:hypothetical protein
MKKKKKRKKTATRRRQGRIDGDICFGFLIADRNIKVSKVHLLSVPASASQSSEKCVVSLFIPEPYPLISEHNWLSNRFILYFLFPSGFLTSAVIINNKAKQLAIH